MANFCDWRMVHRRDLRQSSCRQGNSQKRCQNPCQETKKAHRSASLSENYEAVCYFLTATTESPVPAVLVVL